MSEIGSEHLEVHNERHQWFLDREGKIVWPIRLECQCLVCVNGYVNGIIIQNRFNADGLWVEEEESRDENWPIKYFDTWQERNKWEEDYFEEEAWTVVKRINKYALDMSRGKIKKKMHSPIMRNGRRQHRNDDCACGSGKKYKKCCLAQQKMNPNLN